MSIGNVRNGVDLTPNSSGNGTAGTEKINMYAGRTAATCLDIIIIGGGIGGLAAALCLAHAGHNITIFEAARKLREVGAGLQVSPNVTRLLHRWGMSDRLSACASEPEALVFRRYKDGEVVGRTKWGKNVREEFGAPYYHMHRADLHRILLQRLRECTNVTFRLNSRVQSLDPHPDARGKVAISLVNGDIFESDLIVGADGVHSLSRQIVCGRVDLAQKTGDAAYRAVIPAEFLLEDEDLRSLMETPELTTWMGPGRHIMGYCIRAQKEYNLVMLHPDHGAEESYTAEGNADRMREDFADFEIRVRKLLKLIDRTLIWRIDERQPLKSWVHSSGRLVLLGDACHPMLPYRAQGAAMAIEDAAVLGNLLSHLGPPSIATRHLLMLLKQYERLRMERTRMTQETSTLNRYIFHLPDGPEQSARDASMRRAMKAEEVEEAASSSSHFDTTNAADSNESATTGSETKSTGSGTHHHRARNTENANQWADRKKNREQYGYDADLEVEQWWTSEGKMRLQKLILSHEGVSTRSEDSATLSSSNSGSQKSGKRGFWRRLPFMGMGSGKKVFEEVRA
ncbi:FAD/NAD-binding domain-containing protein [Fomitiporia mediterranea MF3/22]|uniref:FAD/NAD-binding domain-containing protein n=1 Tax=Fomitiporia mediterranea (strain MF3/22) TaxID=694068 RepID=UPI00044080EC|nr:FAD/NAD-binding domain-containing protein [Fomitiporia mediterranea MF3/22]EJC98356.1 FAD/NAD-binding domain-containing protein [Fomitiporia mediterranea MF3/22]